MSIVSLFISTGRLAMPDFDEWSRQWAHAFLVVYSLLSGEISSKQLLLINNQFVTRLIKFFD